MPDRAEQYAELRKQYPQISEAYWELMEDRDRLRVELDGLKSQLAFLLGYHADAVPVEKLAALLAPPADEQDSTVEELRDKVFPPTTHGTGCPPGCCGSGVRQWR